MSGPCLSSSVADHPLRSATRLSLGEPLPRQLADRPRTPLLAPGLAVPGFSMPLRREATTCGINPAFAELFHTKRQIVHVLRTRSPLLFKCIATSEKPFDLHVLTTPPAFILSQDQTLRKEFRNLVILELLNAVSRSSPSILCLELLIGGPNQSHKVNFKEPSPRGKRISRPAGACSVNTFPGENSGKTSG